MRSSPQSPLRKSIQGYFSRHLQAAINGLSELSRAPFVTLMTCAVIGIILALPMGLYLLLKNIEIYSPNLQSNAAFTVYLQPQLTSDDAEKLSQELTKLSGISKVDLISPDTALKDLQAESGVSGISELMQNNPLPWAIVVTPTVGASSQTTISELSSRIKMMPGVRDIQLDMLWMNRLAALLKLIHEVIYALGIFLALAVFLIVNNCIRAATQHAHKEISIIKIIGGTKTFISRPFLYVGAIYGLLGGIIAWQLVDIFLLWLQKPLSNFTDLYSTHLILRGIDLQETLALLFISVSLSLIGSWFAVDHYLSHSAE